MEIILADDDAADFLKAAITLTLSAR